MVYREWKTGTLDKELASLIAEECNIDPFVSLMCISRGISTAEEIEEFISDDLVFEDIYELSGMNSAVEIINSSVKNGELIAIYGDYDCDGVTATALLYTYLKEKGARVIYYIPSRFDEGYGLNKAVIDKLYNSGVSTLITVDNGISAAEEVEYAKELGMNVVITDHHLPQKVLPNADAVIDPHIDGRTAVFKDICGVAVAYKLVCALEDKAPEELIDKYGDLVCIGTLGDVMPLKCENRSFVKAGTGVIKNNCRVGIEALLSAAGVDKNTLNSNKIAFTVVPRINAAGRMETADTAFKLLVTEDINEAEELAKKICEYNITRQNEEKHILEEAEQIIEKSGYNYDRVIVVCGKEWHKGVLGIVAARLCEKYGKPTVVLTEEGEFSVGSSRSYSGCSLYDIIVSGQGLLEKFGGHDLAAGLTLKSENVDEFRKTVNRFCANTKYEYPCVKIDCKINPQILTADLADELKVFEPYGPSNMPFLFGIYGCTVEKITPLSGDKHIKLLLTKKGYAFNAVIFGMSSEGFPFTVGETIDVAVNIDKSIYNGKEFLSVQIRTFRPSGEYSEEMSDENRLYDDFFAGIKGNYERIIPTREEFAEVYKYLLKTNSNEYKTVQKFLAKTGEAKTKIIIKVFTQSGLINVKDGNFFIDRSVKFNLSENEIISGLKGGERIGRRT